MNSFKVYGNEVVLFSQAVVTERLERPDTAAPVRSMTNCLSKS